MKRIYVNRDGVIRPKNIFDKLRLMWKGYWRNTVYMDAKIEVVYEKTEHAYVCRYYKVDMNYRTGEFVLRAFGTRGFYTIIDGGLPEQLHKLSYDALTKCIKDGATEMVFEV